MKLKAIGTGGPYCRWPLIPPCWLIQTHQTNVLVGCPPQAGARLELSGISIKEIDMVIVLGDSVSQAGGLDEIGYICGYREEKPYLVCPEVLLKKLALKYDNLSGFQTKAVTKVGFKEDHITETFSFVDNHSGGYGFRLEESKVFCSGIAKVNEEWLSAHMDCEIMLHQEHQELTALPIYLQNKLWVFGYDKMQETADMLPMLFLPQGSCVFDSDRRDKIMTKERFIRENSKRVLGNEGTK